MDRTGGRGIGEKEVLERDLNAASTESLSAASAEGVPI